MRSETLQKLTAASGFAMAVSTVSVVVAPQYFAYLFPDGQYHHWVVMTPWLVAVSCLGFGIYSEKLEDAETRDADGRTPSELRVDVTIEICACGLLGLPFAGGCVYGYLMAKYVMTTSNWSVLGPFVVLLVLNALSHFVKSVEMFYFGTQCLSAYKEGAHLANEALFLQSAVSWTVRCFAAMICVATVNTERVRNLVHITKIEHLDNMKNRSKLGWHTWDKLQKLQSPCLQVSSNMPDKTVWTCRQRFLSLLLLGFGSTSPKSIAGKRNMFAIPVHFEVPKQSASAWPKVFALIYGAATFVVLYERPGAQKELGVQVCVWVFMAFTAFASVCRFLGFVLSTLDDVQGNTRLFKKFSALTLGHDQKTAWMVEPTRSIRLKAKHEKNPAASAQSYNQLESGENHYQENQNVIKEVNKPGDVPLPFNLTDVKQMEAWWSMWKYLQIDAMDETLIMDCLISITVTLSALNGLLLFWGWIVLNEPAVNLAVVTLNMLGGCILFAKCATVCITLNDTCLQNAKSMEQKRLAVWITGEKDESAAAKCTLLCILHDKLVEDDELQTLFGFPITSELRNRLVTSALITIGFAALKGIKELQAHVHDPEKPA